MPSFKCMDIGMACGFEESSLTRGGLMKKVAAHAKSVHGLDPIPTDVLQKVQAAIK